MSQQQNLAIRFGLGAIKAVGFNMMEKAAAERKKNGKFEDIYDFATRLDPKSINKKSIEALAKAGAFDQFNKNRRQLAESFDLLSAYAAKQHEESSSSQMSLFGGLPEVNAAPKLREIDDWNKAERLQKEFEAFGYFLNEHPLDDHVSELKKRGVIFSEKIERDELQNDDLVKIAGVVAGSKHRSSARGRFAYLTLSDPYGIFEAMIFDEALITSARDLLIDGTPIVIECGIRKDDGGLRISVRDVKRLDLFIKNTEAHSEEFEDIKKVPSRFNNDRGGWNNGGKKNWGEKKSEAPKRESSVAGLANVGKNNAAPVAATPKTFTQIEILINKREAIVMLKSLLSQRVATNAEKSTKVTFEIISSDGEVMKIALPTNYEINETDLIRLRRVDGVSSIKTS
jgi:DNA polymerase III alpha subunit